MTRQLPSAVASRVHGDMAAFTLAIPSLTGQPIKAFALGYRPHWPGQRQTPRRDGKSLAYRVVGAGLSLHGRVADPFVEFSH